MDLNSQKLHMLVSKHIKCETLTMSETMSEDAMWVNVCGWEKNVCSFNERWTGVYLNIQTLLLFKGP